MPFWTVAGRRYCPGPSRSWRGIRAALRLLALHRMFLRCGCFYDLSGLPWAAGPITCPECGRRLFQPREGWRTTRRLRLVPCIIVLLVTACALMQYGRSWRWLRYTPTVVLAAAEHLPHNWQSGRVRRELDNRRWNNRVSSRDATVLIPAFIRDLRDDDVNGNALRAIDWLERLGDQAVPALKRALNSDDWQQRQLAADVLRRNRDYLPCNDLLRVTVEGLRDDDLPYGPPRPSAPHGTRTYIRNAFVGVFYLAQHPHDSEPFLATALHSDDDQQRLLAAAAAGMGGCHALMDDAAPILIRHLGKGGRYGWAIRGIQGFGPAILPRLVPVLHDEDPHRARRARELLMAMQDDLKRELASAP